MLKISLDFVETARKVLELQGFTDIEIDLTKDDVAYTCTISGEHPAKVGRITVNPIFAAEQAVQALFQSILAMIESVNKTIGDALNSDEG